MTPLKRKILFYIFLLAFLVISPLVVLYASGYKIDWRHPFSPMMVQKTGMLLISSEPASAYIYLDGKKQKNPGLLIVNQDANALKTPIKIKNLLPGAYDLKVELPGYWPWERRVKVYSGQITHVLDVRLFRNDLPALVVKAGAEEGLISPNKKKFFLPQSGLLVDLKSETSEKISSSSAEASWSPDSNKIIANGRIINLKSPEKKIVLSELIGQELSNFKWNRNDSGKIYYQHLGSLNIFDLNDQKNETVADEENILDYLPKNDRLYYISRQGLANKLKVYSLSDKKIIREIEMPPSDGYKFINPENRFLNILDEKYNLLYLVNPDSSLQPLEEVISQVKRAEWFDDQTLFFANDFEIWMLDKEKNQRRLLLRWSEPINGLLKTKIDNYLVYSTAKNFNILTWDKGSEEIKVTELFKFDAASGPAMNEDDGILYFTAKIGNQEGLYKLNLQ